MNQWHIIISHEKEEIGIKEGIGMTAINEEDCTIIVKASNIVEAVRKMASLISNGPSPINNTYFIVLDDSMNVVTNMFYEELKKLSYKG